MDLPREIRDMIYAEGLIFNSFLVAEREQRRRPYDPPLTPASTALLQVNKTVNTEATTIFYALNTFKLSYDAAYGRPSIFTTHATRFRRVFLEFNYHSHEEHKILAKKDILAGEAGSFPNSIWTHHIRALFPMINLQLLQQGVAVFDEEIPLEPRVTELEVTSMRYLAAYRLEPELLANLPPSITLYGPSLDSVSEGEGEGFSQSEAALALANQSNG